MNLADRFGFKKFLLFANLSVTNTCSSSYESLFVSNKSLYDTCFAVMAQSCQKEVEPMSSRTRYSLFNVKCVF